MSQSKIQQDHIHSPMLTDLYQITMAYSYFQSNRHNKIASFEVFLRKCPFKGNYIIAAGITEVIKMIKDFKFDKSDTDYLRKTMTDLKDDKFWDYLQNLNLQNKDKIEIKTLQEGTIYFPQIPIIQITGPIGIVQLLETPILNIVNFACLMATNASRMRTEAYFHKTIKPLLMEFGLRRAQGPDGGLYASMYSYVGGFDATSNVLAGTMAHSYITSFQGDENTCLTVNQKDISAKARQYRKELFNDNTHSGEFEAFLQFAQSYPSKFIVLIDTYNTLQSGVLNYICVMLAFAYHQQLPQASGFRLDSGDLAELSKETRKIVNQYQEQIGYKFNFKISASNDINEESISELNQKDHQIDAFGVGTNLVTCQKQPALGMVFKLVEFENKGKMKLSQESGKSTLPGKKQVFRVWKNQEPICDIITLSTENLDKNQIQAVDINIYNNRFIIQADSIEPLLNDAQEITLQQARQNFLDTKQKFGENSKYLKNQNSEKYKILLSKQYFDYFQNISNQNIIYNKI